MNKVCWLVAASLAICSAQVTEPATTTTSEECKSADIHGIIEIGCWGYLECRENVRLIHMCPKGQVLQKSTMLCVTKGLSGTECDNDTDCTNQPDDMYPNVGDKCHSYYRCYGALNIGQFYCPASLVFNVDAQTCDFPSNVVPPCGTKPPVTPQSKTVNERRRRRHVNRRRRNV